MQNPIPNQTIVGLSLDALLMSQVAEQDPAALTRLYESTVCRVLGVAQGILHCSEAAEEVVCDVYVYAWRNASEFDPKRGSVADWLRAIARNQATLRLRERPVVDARRTRWQAGVMHDALAALAPMRKRVLELALLQGLTHPEIAERTQLSIGRVRSLIRRSLAALQSSLELEA